MRKEEVSLEIRFIGFIRGSLTVSTFNDFNDFNEKRVQFERYII